jgi:hypothetical protein
MSVTFETSVWERDWQKILCTPLLGEMIARCHHPFQRKRLYINNVENLLAVRQAAAQLVEQGILDEYTVVDDYADEALNYFKLSRETLGRGYFYSIQLLVSVFLTATEYLLHFSGDSIAGAPHRPDWLSAGLSILQGKPEIKVFNLTWNHRYWEAELESDSQDEDFYYGYGFSDQMYLVRTQDFKTADFNQFHPASARYPSYGGDSFEKRVDSWMRNALHRRATYKHASYLHPTL